MTKSEKVLDNVELEVALEILAMKISMTICSDNGKELEKLLIEKERIYRNDKKVIKKVFNTYGSELKAILKGEKEHDK